MELKELLAEITYEVDAKISNPDFGGFPHEQFLEWCGEQLSEFGEIEAGSLTPSTYEQRGRAIHGFSYSHHDGRLDLFITHYKRAADEYPLYKSDVDASIKRVRNFFERYSQGADNDIDGDEEAWDLVEIIKRSEIALVRIFLVTDGRTTVKRIDPSEDDLIPIQVHVWDIERFLRNRVSGDLFEDT